MVRAYIDNYEIISLGLRVSGKYRLIIDRSLIDKSIYIISRQRLSRFFLLSGGSGGGGGTGQKIRTMRTVRRYDSRSQAR